MEHVDWISFWGDNLDNRMDGGFQRQRTKIVIWRYEYSKKSGEERSLDRVGTLCMEVYKTPQEDRDKGRRELRMDLWGTSF